MSIEKQSIVPQQSSQFLVREIGEKGLVFSAAGSGPGLLLGSTFVAGVGAVIGLLLGLGFGLLEGRESQG